MNAVRQTILYVAALIGTWLLISFGGAMFNHANAAFWSDSLMWSLLSFMVIAPALIFLSSLPKSTSSSETTQQSFVDEESKQHETLWPESEEDTGSPLTGEGSSPSTQAQF